ncbi:hypothetical protein NKH18_26865 [Streptomyces sp. M10(2022)]
MQFLMGTQVPGTDTIGRAAVPDPDFQQQISIDVNDINAPVVTVDDRTARAQDDDGARITYTATATDAQDGTLPVTCAPHQARSSPSGRPRSAARPRTRQGTPARTPPSSRCWHRHRRRIPTPPPPPPPSADVAVKVDVSPDRTYVGRRAAARVTVTNAGPDAATGVVIGATWPKPSKAKDRSLRAQSRCTAAKPCMIPAGGRIEVTQMATYRAAITGNVRTTVRGKLPDRRMVNNRDTDRLRVLKPSLTVTPQVAKPGQPVLARARTIRPARPYVSRGTSASPPTGRAYGWAATAPSRCRCWSCARTPSGRAPCGPPPATSPPPEAGSGGATQPPATGLRGPIMRARSPDDPRGGRRTTGPDPRGGARRRPDRGGLRRADQGVGGQGQRAHGQPLPLRHP